jgi:xylan 1,4-beta-xylosidase
MVNISGLKPRSGCVFFLAVAFSLAAYSQQPASRSIVADMKHTSGPVDRFFDFSVGSDYSGTLIRDDSQAQLKIAVDELGFRYLRFHDIFHDVLGTVRIENGKTVYNWSKIDQLYDDLQARHIKPFVELGFTPKALATSEHMIFYWKGNVSLPKSQGWQDLVSAFTRHIEERYGRDEVRTWYFEVWNEPNLIYFWDRGDQKAYFDFYDLTARTVKSIDPALRVGGPATAGADWVPEFLVHVKESGAPVDFVTTHAYGVDGGFLDEDGKEGLKLSPAPDAISGAVLDVRRQISASAFSGLPLYLTEWSSSYSSLDPVHDSYINAPYILNSLGRSRGLLQGMSYWTYSDLFEEQGPPPAPFHGGFGLLNREGIRKPAFFAYKYLHALQGDVIASDDAQAMLATDGKNFEAVVWDFKLPKPIVSDRPFFKKVIPSHPAAPVVLTVAHLVPGTAYHFELHRTGYHSNDAYTAYLEMGAPKDLTAAQLAHLNELTRDLPQKDQTVRSGKDGNVKFTIPMHSNDIVLVTLRPVAQ